MGELLNTEEVSLAIESKFSLNALTMKKDLVWHLSLFMASSLPRFYRQFDATMLFDDEPYEKRVASLKKKLEEVDAEPTMFDNGQATELKRDIEDAEQEWAKLKADCPVIAFPVKVEEIKYKSSYQVLATFIVPDTSIAELNEQRRKIRHYKISLEPKL